MRQSLALLLALCAASCAAPVRELIDAVADADDLDDFQHPLPGLRHELSDLEPFPFNDDVAEIMYLSDADAPSGDDDDAQEPKEPNIADMNAINSWPSWDPDDAQEPKEPKELSIDDEWFDDEWEPSEDDVADDDWRVAEPKEPMPSNRNAKLLSIAEELIDVVADAVAREPKDPDVRVENMLLVLASKWFRCWTDNLYLMPLVEKKDSELARNSEAAEEYKDIDIDDAWLLSYDDNVQDPDDTFMYYGLSDNPKDTDIFY